MNDFYERLKALMDEELKARLHGDEDREAVLSARLNLICDVDIFIHQKGPNGFIGV